MSRANTIKRKVGPSAYEVSDKTTGVVLGRYGGRDGCKWADDAEGNTITEDTSVSVATLVGLIVGTNNRRNRVHITKTRTKRDDMKNKTKSLKAALNAGLRGVKIAEDGECDCAFAIYPTSELGEWCSLCGTQYAFATVYLNPTTGIYDVYDAYPDLYRGVDISDERLRKSCKTPADATVAIAEMVTEIFKVSE